MSFFSLSKLLWVLFAPSFVLVWLAVATAIAIFLQRQRLAQILAATSSTLFILIGLLPLHVLLLRPLENLLPRPPWPTRVDGIVVLGGGGLDAAVLRSRGVVPSNTGETRLVAAFELSRRYPTARIVFSGGALSGNTRLAEAVVAREVFRQLGLDPKRITFDDKARNTLENLINAKRLVKPKKNEIWLLATSASHLPRAVSVASSLDWPMIPWATDYGSMSRGGVLYLQTPSSNLTMMDVAAREWLGLLYYRLAGKLG